MSAKSLVGVLAALTSAVLLAASQSQRMLWPIAAVALAPWLLASTSASRLAAAGLGALVGTLSASFVVSWIPEALRALGSSPGKSFAGLLLTTGWAKAPLFAITGLLWRELSRLPAWASCLLLGAAFGCGEAWISSAVWGVPAVLLGHSQLPATGVAQLALVGGVPLISAWLVALNAAIALVLSGRRAASSAAAGLTVGWLAAAGLGLAVAESVRPDASSHASTNLLVVQPEIPRHARWAAEAQPWVLEQVTAYTTKALTDERSVDAIVWPENLLTTPIDAAPGLLRELRRHVDAWGTPLMTGVVRAGVAGDGSYRSSVVWIEPTRGVTAGIDKVRAVPLVESGRSLPGGSLLESAFGRAAHGRKVEEAPRAEPLKGPISLTPMLCYEVLFPGIAAVRRTSDSFGIVNLADDSWVQGDTATQQLSAWAAFRAIEQRLTLVRIAHGGLSTVIDEYGRTLDALPLDTFGHLHVTLYPSAPPALVERIAIALVALVPALVVWCAWLALNRGGVVDGEDAVADRRSVRRPHVLDGERK